MYSKNDLKKWKKLNDKVNKDYFSLTDKERVELSSLTILLKENGYFDVRDSSFTFKTQSFSLGNPFMG